MNLNFKYDFIEEEKKNRCWNGYEPVPGKKPFSPGSCRKKKKSKKIEESLKPSDYGLKGFNKPKRTPNHPTKSHMVLAKVGSRKKIIRFGQQGVKGSPKKEGESKAYRNRRNSFRARHSKNIAKGKMSAAWWSNATKW